MPNEVEFIIIAISVLSFFTFTALFGQVPAFRKTPISFIHRCIWIHLPHILRGIDDRLAGGYLSSSSARLANYLVNEKHPIVLLAFVALLAVAEMLFIPRVWHQLSNTHHVLVPLAVALPYIFLYLSASADPGIITASNLSRFLRVYPFDHALYYPRHECRTCRTLKPARSKHCKICKCCIARLDHHCVWINNCVGQGNYRSFMSLLLSTGVLTSYGAYVAHMLMSSTLQIAYFVSVQRDQAATSDRVLQDRSWSGGLTWAEYGNAWGWAILEDRSIGTVGLLCLLCSPLAWGLFWYHVYLIWAGTTTNETGKWTELKEDMADGIVVKAKRSRVIFSPSDNKQEAGKEADDVEPAVEWPAMTDQVLRRLEEDEEDPVEGGIWQKVWSLAEVENMYDLGFWDNLMDTVFS